MSGYVYTYIGHIRGEHGIKIGICTTDQLKKQIRKNIADGIETKTIKIFRSDDYKKLRDEIIDHMCMLYNLTRINGTTTWFQCNDTMYEKLVDELKNQGEYIGWRKMRKFKKFIASLNSDDYNEKYNTKRIGMGVGGVIVFILILISL